MRKPVDSAWDPDLGQVAGVAISSAVFQSSLDHELHRRIQGECSEEVCARSMSEFVLIQTPSC